MTINLAIRHSSLNTLGGGELVALTIIDEMLRQDVNVTLYSLFHPNLEMLSSIFNFSLSNINIVSIFPSSYENNVFTKIPFALDLLQAKKLSNLKKYDIILDTSNNGYFPIKNQTASCQCYVHFPMNPLDSKKVPFKKSRIYSDMWNSFDKCYRSYDNIYSNSNFTASYLKENTKFESKVIYPPVKLLFNPDDSKYLESVKGNIFASVGRIGPEKKFEIIIEVFKNIYRNYNNYCLIIIGTVYDNNYFNYLTRISKGYPIHFFTNCPRHQMVELLKKSKFYIHAKGYGETNPKNFEHFGISTVEAMNCGCIPLAINKGGQPEIVDHNKNGFVWNSLEELEKCLLNLMSIDNLGIYSSEAIKKSMQYSDEIFREKIYREMTMSYEM